MKFKGLILALTFFTILVGCDHPKLRSTFLTIGFIEPEYGDIQYQDKNLDVLFNEIYSLEIDKKLLSEEYDWILSRLELCEQSSDTEACLNEENSQHQIKLQSILIEQLLSISLEEKVVNSLKLPVDINTLSMERPDRHPPPQMAYAPKAQVLAYQGGDGKVHLVNLKTGSYLHKIEQTYKSNPFKNSLQLSENGKLLLTQYDKKFELISTSTGNRLALKEYSGEGYFTKSGRHILLKAKKSIVLLNTKNLELTGALLEFPVGHRYMSFNPSTNTIATWGADSKDVVFYSINEKLTTFEKKSRIVINEIGRRRGHKVDHILFPSDGESAYVFVLNALFKLNLTNSSYYEFIRLPYSFISKNIIIQNDFIVTKGLIYKRKGDGGNLDRYIDVIDLVQGKFSFIEQSNLRDSVFLASPIENTLLIGKGLGVQQFKIEREKLTFKYSEELSPPVTKNKPRKNSTKNINQSKTLFDKKVKFVSKGTDGIDQALHLGLIRPATDKDMALWKSKNKRHSELLSKTRAFNRYVVLKPVKFNGGLTGANSVIFIAKNSKVAPYGSIGHSIVLFSDTGACQGLLCKSL